MDNKGQVGVVVAILVVVLIVAVLVIIQTYYVPQWMKEREAEHMDVVANQFAGLKYSLDLQTMEQSSSPLTNSITLGSKELPYFVTARAFGSLQIVNYSQSNFTVRVSGEGMRAQPQAHYISTGNVSYILSINTFDLCIQNAQAGDYYNVSFYSAEISARVAEFINESFCQVILTVINESEVIYNQSVVVGIATGGSYCINLLNDDYKISTKILPYVPTPFNMSFNSSTHGQFILECTEYVEETIYISNSFGIIKYESDNVYFVDQNYIYEGGAVILSQRMGSTMLFPPFIEIVNATRRINITLIDVIGVAGKTGATGYGTYSIRTNFSQITSHRLLMENLTLYIFSDYYSAWENYLENRMNESGITYQLTEGDGYISITFSNVELSFNIARVYAQVGPGWVT